MKFQCNATGGHTFFEEKFYKQNLRKVCDYKVSENVNEQTFIFI